MYAVQTQINFRFCHVFSQKRLKKKKVKLVNKNTTTRRNPDSTSEIYLIAVKAAQCRQVDENRREKGEVKKEIAIETLTINVHLQLKRSKAFDR